MISYKRKEICHVIKAKRPEKKMAHLQSLSGFFIFSSSETLTDSGRKFLRAGLTYLRFLCRLRGIRSTKGCVFLLKAWTGFLNSPSAQTAEIPLTTQKSTAQVLLLWSDFCQEVYFKITNFFFPQLTILTFFSDSIRKEPWFNSSRQLATLLFVDWLPTG